MINETFTKHLGLLHKKLGLIKENTNYYKSFPDGTEIEVDRFSGKLVGFIYKGTFLDILDFKDLGWEDEWSDEEKQRVTPTLKDSAYRVPLNRGEMVFYPEAIGGPVYFSAERSN